MCMPTHSPCMYTSNIYIYIYIYIHHVYATTTRSPMHVY